MESLLESLCHGVVSLNCLQLSLDWLKQVIEFVQSVQKGSRDLIRQEFFSYPDMIRHPGYHRQCH
jgi:hypothetical protein